MDALSLCVHAAGGVPRAEQAGCSGRVHDTGPGGHIRWADGGSEGGVSGGGGELRVGRPVSDGRTPRINCCRLHSGQAPVRLENGQLAFLALRGVCRVDCVTRCVRGEQHGSGGHDASSSVL